MFILASSQVLTSIVSCACVGVVVVVALSVVRLLCLLRSFLFFGVVDAILLVEFILAWRAIGTFLKALTHLFLVKV